MHPSNRPKTSVRDSARRVKIFSGLAMMLGMPGCIAGTATHSDITLGFFALVFCGGFIGFVVGRFME